MFEGVPECLSRIRDNLQIPRGTGRAPMQLRGYPAYAYVDSELMAAVDAYRALSGVGISEVEMALEICDQSADTSGYKPPCTFLFDDTEWLRSHSLGAVDAVGALAIGLERSERLGLPGAVSTEDIDPSDFIRYVAGEYLATAVALVPDTKSTSNTRYRDMRLGVYYSSAEVYDILASGVVESIGYSAVRHAMVAAKCRKYLLPEMLEVVRGVKSTKFLSVTQAVIRRHAFIS